jgi:thymidylate kinase
MGAGKTTLYRRALERLDEQGRVVWTPRRVAALWGVSPLSRIRRFAYRVAASWRSRPVVFLAMRNILVSRRPSAETARAVRWFLTCLGNHWKARLTIPGENIVLADEGLAQKMFSLFVSARDEIDLAAVRDYARLLPAPDLLIYLVVDPAVAATRALARPRRRARRFQTLDDATRRTVFANAARALDVLVDEMRSTRSVHVIVIDTNDLDRATTELDGHVDTFLATTSDSTHRMPAVEVTFPNHSFEVPQ